MPIQSNASYVPVINEFLAHWGDVNVALPQDKPLILKSALARAGLITLRNDLQTLLDGVQEKLNEVEIASGALLLKKEPILARLNEFNGVVEAYFGGTALANARPKAPGITEGEEKFTEPLRDMKSLWAKVNAQVAPPGMVLPLVLDGGLDLAGFVTLLGQLRDAFADVQQREHDLSFERKLRDAKMGVIYDSLKLYRLSVPARLPNNVPLLESMPKLTPDAGSTPDAVNASAVFVAPDQSKTVYDASEAPDVAAYELRGNSGPVYKSDDAQVIASNAPDAPREFVTNFGLTQPGAKISMVVVVKTASGHEKASAPMTVARPV
ncbi:MAG: hypothetical protein RL514_1180 [Verrucomicrobiota bacterium]|jgi:hypothetical protein